jgi:FixJ family two-component response regulator
METPTHAADTHPRRLVLVVDDDSRLRESLAGLLRAAGMALLTFSSGEALVGSTALGEAGCLITDVRMPGMDGWELLRQVSATHPRLPVIFISAFQDQQAFERALAKGAFAFLYKPFDGEELLRTVESAFLETAGL